MALILNIDTSSLTSSVALSDNDKIIAYAEGTSNNHTQVLLPLINTLLNSSGYNIKSLAAIAVNIGPGSYTGLRVGVAVAKGLCYTTSIPLISLSGLTAITAAAIRENKNKSGLYLSIIDNQRGGWYYSIYDENLNLTKPFDSIDHLDEVIAQILHQNIFVCKANTGDVSNLGNISNLNFIEGIKLNAKTLALIPAKEKDMTNKQTLLLLQPLYINSIFKFK